VFPYDTVVRVSLWIGVAAVAVLFGWGSWQRRWIADDGLIVLRTVRKLTPQMEAVCNGHGRLGTGGMRSKLRAAKVASEAGASVAIANGRHDQAIPSALKRKIGTYFPPKRR